MLPALIQPVELESLAVPQGRLGLSVPGEFENGLQPVSSKPMLLPKPLKLPWIIVVIREANKYRGASLSTRIILKP